MEEKLTGQWESVRVERWIGGAWEDVSRRYGRTVLDFDLCETVLAGGLLRQAFTPGGDTVEYPCEQLAPGRIRITIPTCLPPLRIEYTAAAS